MYLLYTPLYFLFNFIIFVGSFYRDGFTIFDSVILSFKEKGLTNIINGSIGSIHLWYIWALALAIPFLFFSFKENIVPRIL